MGPGSDQHFDAFGERLCRELAWVAMSDIKAACGFPPYRIEAIEAQIEMTRVSMRCPGLFMRPNFNTDGTLSVMVGIPDPVLSEIRKVWERRS